MEGVDEDEIKEKLGECKNFLGTYSLGDLDRIKIHNYPVILIINLDHRQNGGLHWISVGLYNHKVEIIDSLGALVPGEFPYELIDFLNIITFHRKVYITKQLQELSAKTCGYYCVLYAKEKCHGGSLQSFLSNFSSDLKSNDSTVKRLYKAMFPEINASR